MSGIAYTGTIVVTGILLGTLTERFVRAVPDAKLARVFNFFATVLLCISFSVSAFAILSSPSKWATGIGSVAGMTVGICFSGVFGFAVFRKESRHFLSEPMILMPFKMATALLFAFAGIGKAFNMTYMTQFFLQSGYTISFLHFLMLSEVLGAIVFLLPWGLIPAMLAFAVDMFGAIFTHIHNRDPLEDSAGAIGMITRLAYIAIILVIAPRGVFTRFSIHARIGIAAFATLSALVVARIGSLMLHTSS